MQKKINDKLSRYMSLENYYQLLKTERIEQRNPIDWQDPYENIIQRCFLEQKRFLKLYLSCSEYALRNNIHTNTVLAHLYFHSKSIFCLCLTKDLSKNGIDSMWRSYSYNNSSVRITFKDNFFIREDCGYNTTIEDKVVGVTILKKVIYKKINFNSFVEFILEDKTDKMITPYIYKRPEFKYEKEIRWMTKYKLPEEVKEEFNKGFFEKQNFKTLTEFNKCINQFDLNKCYYGYPETIKHGAINKILINPWANESIEFSIKKIAEKFGLADKVEKSRLYDLN